MAAMIEAILADLKAKSKFGLITRNNYTNIFTVEDMMAEIEAVGKFRDPRFVIDSNNRFAYTNLAKWLLGDPTMQCLNPETGLVETGSLTKGIYLAGNTGTGKTWAIDILSYLGKAHNFRYTSRGKDERFEICCTRAASAVDRFVRNEDPLYQHIVCFNDLGAEQKEAIYMGNRLNVMRDYIEERADDQYLITCFTSNYPMLHPFVAESYGDRAVSRLRLMCNYLEMRGEDRRK